MQFEIIEGPNPETRKLYNDAGKFVIVNADDLDAHLFWGQKGYSYDKRPFAIKPKAEEKHVN